MSKTLDTLVRLKQFELDIKRRALKELQEQDDMTREAIVNLEKERLQEAEKAKNDPALLRTYGNYSNRIKQKKIAFEGFLTELAPKLEIARDELAEAFAEYKKVEISRDNQNEKELAEENRKDQIEQDELGMQGNRRLKKHDENR